MIPIIVDTAVVVPVNIMPLTDDGDFKTRETAVDYNATGMDLVWNFVTPAGAVTQTAVTPTTGGVYDWAHAGDGMYTIEIPASAGGTINNDTEGVGYFTGVATGVLPWRGPNILFGSANAVNSIFGLDRQEVDVLEIGNSAQSATDLKDFADTGYDPSTHKVAGVVLADTVNSLTNLPAITANWLTAAGLATDAVNELRDAIWNAAVSALTTTGSIGKEFVDGLIQIAELWNRLTDARAALLDNLNIGGNVASSAEVTSVQNNTRVVRVVPTVIERPDSGTTTYRIELLAYDDVGNMEAPDSAPTLALVDQGGTDLSARLDSATGSLVSTGRYRWVYTATNTDDLEQLVWTFSVVEGGNTRLYGNTSVIVDTTAVDFTSADRTKLEAIHTKLPSKSYLTGTGNSDGDIDASEATGNFPGSVASVTGDVGGKVLGGGSGTIAGTGARVVDGDGNAIATAAAQTTAQNDLDILTGTDGATLATSQGNYAPAKAGDEMDLVDAPNATAVTEIQSGLATTTELATALGSADDAVLAAIAALNNISTDNVTTSVTTALTTALTEAYRSTGATGSVAQLLYEIVAHLGNAGIVDTTKTLKKLDKSTTAKTYTLDDATTPTAIEETT